MHFFWHNFSPEKFVFKFVMNFGKFVHKICLSSYLCSHVSSQCHQSSSVAFSEWLPKQWCAWSTQITAKESARIESVLKTGLCLVFGEQYQYFLWALNVADMSSMKNQRTQALNNFTGDCLKNQKLKNWFAETETDTQKVATQRQKPWFKPVPARTNSYARSAIPQMV